MAISFSLILLLVALFTTTTTLRPISATETSPPPQPPSLPTTPPPPPHQPPSLPTSPPPPPPVSTAQILPPPPQTTLADIQQNQLNNIIDALIGAGDFAGWANLLSSTDPSSLPLTATLFIPTNDAISTNTTAGTTTYDPLLIAYHIVPQRLTFSDLTQFSTQTRLPTLLPDKYIVITNNSNTNYTVDDSQIIQADIFVNIAFSVHGIRKVLDYSLYSGNAALSPPPVKPFLLGETTVGLRSAASYSLSRVSMSISTLCAAALAIKILQEF